MDDLTVDGKQREQRSAAAGLREALCLAGGRARAAQELKEALCGAEMKIDRGGVYVARSVQELRHATRGTDQEAVEATKGQHREDAAVEKRNKLRGELDQ